MSFRAVIFLFAITVVSGQQLLLFKDAIRPLTVGTGPKQLSYFAGNANDGTFEVEGDYMVLRSKPFSSTVPPSPLGTLDHVKWLAFINKPFNVPTDGTELLITLSGTSQIFNTNANPFRIDSNDPRLATTALNAIDTVTSLVADFFITNDKIYVLYERLPFARATDGNYASFTYLIPVLDRSKSDQFKLQIAFNGKDRYLRYIVNDVEVFRVTRLGYRLPGYGADYQVLDLGGIEQDVFPESVQVGFGTFSLLDGFTPCRTNIKNGQLKPCSYRTYPGYLQGIGLVQLVSTPNTYFVPGTETYASFYNDGEDTNSRIFGQGAELKISSMLVGISPAPKQSCLC